MSNYKQSWWEVSDFGKPNAIEYRYKIKELENVMFADIVIFN